MVMDVLDRDNLPFPRSLPEFQRLFQNETPCMSYLENSRWIGGFSCPGCQAVGEPIRFAGRPDVLRCRICRHDASLTAGTVMERTHTPLMVWFWAAYLVTSQTHGMSCRAIPEAAWTFALRDGLSDSSQAARRHGAARSGSDWWKVGRIR